MIYAGYESLKNDDPVVPTEWGSQGPLTLPPATGEEKAAVGTVYTCRMHPDVRVDHPGNCPKCGMKLVPEKAEVRGQGSGVGGGGMPGMPGMRGGR